jgi:hypothetical protein
MRVITIAGRIVAHLLTTIAKTIGGMNGAGTFDQDNATSLYRRRRDHRP